jgi:hypothetical protein
MGRTAEGRSEALSWWSWQMTLPPLQMLPSRPPNKEQGQWRTRRLFLYASSGEAVEQLELEMKDSRKD